MTGVGSGLALPYIKKTWRPIPVVMGLGTVLCPRISNPEPQKYSHNIN